jgi:electron transfer flavoprotein alpha subunit
MRIAAIFNIAHYGSAVDLYDVADALEEQLA